MSNSVQHRGPQLTRLLCSQYSHVQSLYELYKDMSISLSVEFDSSQLRGLYSVRFLCPWNPLGKNIGVGSCTLLHGIFPTQRSNLGVPHCRQTLYCLSNQGRPYLVLEILTSIPHINMVDSEWKSYYNAEQIQRIKLYWGTNPRNPICRHPEQDLLPSLLKHGAFQIAQ